MRIRRPMFRLTAAVTVAVLAFPAASGPVLAQPATPPDAAAQQTADPPARVGRLTLLRGTVSFHGPSDTQWSAATANYPFTAGDSLWTEAGSTASVDVSASRISLAGGTEFDLAGLDDNGLQGSMPQGEAYLHLRALAPNETWTIQTPRGSVTLTGAGRYAVTAGTTDTPTLVTVLEGTAQLSGSGIDLQVAANQTATITGSDTFQAEIGPAAHDPFIDAMLARERPPAQAAVAPPPAVMTMPGGEDLGAYGTWSEAPQYGQVWYPPVSPGWIPYRDGHWAYIAPWGWTWVDDAPWGFAPFHYGRWIEIGDRWAWVPGVAEGPVYRPVYAPALVTFFGVGAGVGVGLGAALAVGSVGWCPLGPREPYRPWYHASDRYLREVNINHVTNITTINRNITINNYINHRAAIIVPADAMRGSRPIGQFARPVPAQTLGGAQPVFGRQPLRPSMATAGVTPATARQMNLGPVPGTPIHRAPGPAIRAQAPAPASPGRPPQPNPVQPGGAPTGGAPYQRGSQHELPLPGGPGGHTGAAPTNGPTNPARAPHPEGTAPNHVPSAPQPNHPTFQGPHVVAPRAPEVTPPVTPQAVPHAAPQMPQVVHPTPAPRPAPTPAPQFHQPPPQAHLPPPQMHQPAPQPAFHQPPPVHTAPPQMHAAPPPAQHAPPPAQHEKPPGER